MKREGESRSYCEMGTSFAYAKNIYLSLIDILKDIHIQNFIFDKLI